MFPTKPNDRPGCLCVLPSGREDKYGSDFADDIFKKTLNGYVWICTVILLKFIPGIKTRNTMIGIDNGLASKRRKAITWAIATQRPWIHMASLGPSDSIPDMNSMSQSNTSFYRYIVIGILLPCLVISLIWYDWYNAINTKPIRTRWLYGFVVV